MRAHDGIVRRIVCLFSCGAASAVATKLAIQMTPVNIPLVIQNTYVREEHPDNERFKADCEKWFGRPVETHMNEKYNGSIYEVFERNRYIKGIKGAPCTRLLKREMRDKNLQFGDRVVLGFTAEEQGRLDDFIDANGDLDVWAPLIEMGLKKSDCLAMVAKAGIELPVMYRMGYNNNNCIGCVKGGMGYWNKIRRDFPDAFQRMAALEEKLGAAMFPPRSREPGSPRISLRTLPPDAGRMDDEPDMTCGVMCEHIGNASTWVDSDSETCGEGD